VPLSAYSNSVLFALVRYTRTALRLLHIAMQTRPYHHPVKGAWRFGWASSLLLSDGRCTFPLRGFAQDYLQETFPEFTKFSIQIALESRQINGQCRVLSQTFDCHSRVVYAATHCGCLRCQKVSDSYFSHFIRLAALLPISSLMNF